MSRLVRAPRRGSGERAIHTSSVSEVRRDVSIAVCGSRAEIVGIADDEVRLG